MKRRILSLLLAIVMVVGLLPVGVQAHEEDPDKASTRVLTTDASGYLQIRNAEELLEFAAMVNSGQYTVPARLYADIDMTNVTWREPIGFTAPYQGLFDGQGYTIKNLTVTPMGETAGLFGRTGNGAYIRNVHLQNVQVAYGGAYFCGGLIGYNSGRVEFCSVTGTIDRGGQYCAGLVGFNAQPGAVLQSYAAVTCLTGACPVCQENQSGVSNVFYNSDLAGGGAGFAVTTADFACGAIAYAMGWGQDLDNGKPVQAYPSMRGGKVYRVTTCAGTTYYTNSTDADIHVVQNGVCTGCNAFIIRNADDLYAFASRVNSGETALNGTLVRDIVVNEGTMTADSSSARVWTPIGTESHVYTGTFDGGGFTVSGLYFNDDSAQVAGLFGRSKGTIQNVGLINSYLQAFQWVGGIVGFAHGGSISGCFNASAISARVTAGGIVGQAQHNTVRIWNCWNSGTISATGSTGKASMAGGLVGYVYKVEAYIYNCYNTGVLSATDGATNLNYEGQILGSTYLFVPGYIFVNHTYYSSAVSCGAYGNISSPDRVTGSPVAKDPAAFASGEVAYLLHQGTAGYPGDIWGQTIGTDPAPVLNGKQVYAEQQRLCTADPADCAPTGNYHNTEKTVILHDIALGSDGYANGKCVNCGAECSHSGGTATCAAPAKCHICGEAYGEPDKTHHDESLAFDANGFCANGCYMPAEWVEPVYQIGNAGQLFWFAELVNGGNRKANAVLIYDISLRGREWIPICSTDLYYNTTNYPDKGYEGTFDGQGHVISEFITKGISGQKCSVGLFGTLSGTVRNLGVDNMTFELNGATDVRAAGIAGQMLDGSLVENCFVTNSTLTPNNYIVGGIAACNYAGTIQNCFTYLVTVSGHGRCGNLVSDTRGDISETDRCGTVRNCYTDASRVAGTQSGGLLSDCKEGLRPAHFANGTVVWWLNNASPTGIWKQSFTTPAFVGRTVSASPISTYEQPELSEGVYQIRNESQLQWFTNYVHFTDASAKAILLEDITVKKAWVPIGSGDNPFRGSFDGNGKTVTLGSQNVYQSYYGMFGYTMGADIANLTVKGSLNLYEAVSFIAGIVGQASGGSITGCTSHVSISLSGVKSDGSMKLAGIAGGLYSVDGNGCLVSGCANYGKIVGTKAKECVAGIAGYSNDKNRIVNCANYGEIYAPYCNFVAGILGYVNNSQFGGLENCLNVGRVSGSEHTVEGTTLLPADIIGWARDFATGSIRNNYYRGYFAFGAVRSDKTAEAEKVSDSHLASGKIAYLLGEGWGQVIGTEDYPVPGGQKVSYGYDTCDATQTAPVYTNKTAYDEKPAHTASYTANGDTHSITCGVCGIAMAEPEAHSYENGTCICGMTCNHTFENGACTTCNITGGYYGTEGNESSVWWTLADNTLTIGGNGAMAERKSSQVPWASEAASITSVVLLEGVTYISGWVFNAVNIQSIVIPASVETLGSKAFIDCKALETVTFAQGSRLTAMQERAFENCTVLKQITLPASLTDLAPFAFYSCDDLTHVFVAEGNPVYQDVDGIVYSADGKTIVYYAFNRAGIEFTVPAEVTTIGPGAFAMTRILRYIILPDGLTSIGDMAFYNTYLKNITIPSSVKIIGQEAFLKCHIIETLVIPEGVVTIGKMAFSTMTYLQTVTLPSTVTSIGMNAFSNTFNLKTVNAPCNWDGSLYTFPSEVTVNVADHTAEGGSYSNNGDSHSLTCGVCGSVMAEGEAHSYENGTCICGATEAPQLDESIKIYHTLDLASDISVTFAVLKSAMERYDSYYLEVVLPEYKGNVQAGTSTVRIEPVDKGNYYYFTLTGITAVRMGDMVDAVLHMNKDGRKYISKTDKYSIATYAYAMLNSTTDSKMLTLCADLLRYGAQAQRYKNYRTDALVDAAMTDTHRSYLSDTEALTFTATDSLLGDLASPVIPWVGKTLDLGTKVGMKFVFNAKNYSGDMANLSMKVSYRGSNGETKTVTLTGAEVYNANNGYYSFTFYGLLASELRTVVDVAVYEGETQLTQSLRYSAESYAAKNLAGTLATLCRALFAYSDSAKAYFTK